MNDKFKVITVPTKDNTGMILITQGVCTGSIVKKDYYGMLNEEMGDTYVHLVGIGKNKILPGDTVINLKTKEIYAAGEGDVYPSYEKPIAFSTNSSLTYSKGTLYKIPTLHHSTYTDLIQQHNHSDGSMWIDLEMEQPKYPERTDDIHFDSVIFNQWLKIKDEWFIKTFNDIVVVYEKPLKIEHPNNVAFNYVRASGVKCSDARMVSQAFKAGIDYAKITVNLGDIILANEAESLKELGFDEFCFGGYYENMDNEKYLTLFDLTKLENYIDVLKQSEDILAPTYSKAFKWFRDKHNLYAEIKLDQTMEPKFCYSINWYKETKEHVEWVNLTERDEFFLEYAYEKAELNCLKKLIEIVKNRTNGNI